MESKRIQSIAIQTGVAEDIEQRRRCMHLQEEALKQKNAQQASALVKTGLVSLNHVEPVVKSQPLSVSDVTKVQRNMRRAGRVAAAPFHTAADLGRAATSAAGNAIHAAAGLPLKAVDTTANAALKGAEVASDVGHATANATANATNAVLNKASDLGRATANTASDLGHATVNAAADLGRATADLGRATANTASDLGHATANAAADLGRATANTAASAAHKVADTTANALSTAADIGSSAAHAAANTAVNAAHMAVDAGQAAADVAIPAATAALHKAAEVGEVAAENAAVVAQEAAEAAKPVAKSLFSKAVDLGYRAAGFGTNMASSALHMAADAGNQMLHTAGDYANHYMTAAHKTFLRGQEEIERLRRQTSEEEHFAILNAFKAAQCVRGWLQEKGLAVPLSGRHVEAYWVKLLEEVERTQRLATPLTPKRNMNRIAAMLKDTRFNPLSPHCLTAIKLNRVGADKHYLPAPEAHHNLSGPIAIATPIETPKSVPAVPVESVRAHHVPSSAVTAAPFVPLAAQQVQPTPVAQTTPVAYYPVPVTANGGSFTIPQLDTASLGGNGAPIVILYPVVAQPAPLDASAKQSLSANASEQPLGRAAM